MVQPTDIDNRAAARNEIGQATNGVVNQVAASNYIFDGRAKPFAGDTVSVTSFEASDRPLDSTDIR
ncbi:hypothetical protein, partial [Planktotalea sp.]|uniref:hypothetical protein n=1 Tax=Planktotalea sp. TaxID=2029877 RepID=UPI0032969841